MALGVVISLFEQQTLSKTRVSQEEQKRILDEVRTYAADHSKGLPNFICTQITRRYMDASGLEI